VLWASLRGQEEGQELAEVAEVLLEVVDKNLTFHHGSTVDIRYLTVLRYHTGSRA
jgi:hypothetical protein